MIFGLLEGVDDLELRGFRLRDRGHVLPAEHTPTRQTDEQFLAASRIFNAKNRYFRFSAPLFLLYSGGSGLKVFETKQRSDARRQTTRKKAWVFCARLSSRCHVCKMVVSKALRFGEVTRLPNNGFSVFFVEYRAHRHQSPHFDESELFCLIYFQLYDISRKLIRFFFL